VVEIKLGLTVKRSSYVIQNTIDSETLKQFLLRSGRDVRLKDIKQLMNECGEQCGIEGFNGDSNIDIDIFFRFMTSFLLEPPANQEPE